MTITDMYTENINGREVVGIVFAPREPGFYEFVNPDEHDSYQKLRDPRTGDEITHSSPVEKLMGEIMGKHKYVTVPVKQWQEFRAEYIEMDKLDADELKSAWTDVMKNDPRF